MKKGSPLPPGTSHSPAKRKRTNPFSMGLAEPRPAGAQTWRQGIGSPMLGGAARDWELPDIGSTSIHAAKSWQDADAAAAAIRMQSEQKLQKKQQQQQFSKVSAANASVVQQQDNQSSVALPGSKIPFSQPLQMPNYGFHHKPSDSTVVTASTVSTGASSRSGQSTVSGMSSFGTTVTQPLPPPPITTTQAAPTAVPKAVLYQFYGKKPRRKQLSNEDYFCWNNGGRPHELKFTCIFQCPLTGECFPSGRYGDPRYYIVEFGRTDDGREVETIWYTKKAFAEHGAAAKCYDCMLYREALTQGDHAVASLSRMGMDAPYIREQAPPLPRVPNLIAEKISQTQKRVKDLMG